MGLFDGLFGKKDSEAAIKRLVRKATEQFAQTESRHEAYQKLLDIGTPEAVRGLVQRFQVRVDPGITDDEEKQYVYERLVELGERAVAPLEEFVRKSEQPTWALKALEKLLTQEELIDLILEVLEHEGPDWTRDPEKKITLLRHLAIVQDERIPPRLVPFLKDVNEDVRFAAVSVVVDQPKNEALREPLIEGLLEAKEQSSERMRRHFAEALATTEYAVKGFTPKVQAALPPGFTVDKAGVVRSSR